MGLVNRIVPKGESRTAAEALARELATLPAQAMLGDRSSAYEQFDLPFGEAMQNELRHGLRAMSGVEGGAQRFTERAR